MAKYNILQEKSFAFAIRCVKLYKFLCEEKKEYVLSKQILRSGTSVGANIEESIAGQSEKDFLSKLSISYKEARETTYWLRLLNATEYLSKEEFDSIFTDAEELCKILSKIILTTKNKLSPKSLNS
jgi:four helix bundle protein